MYSGKEPFWVSAGTNFKTDLYSHKNIRTMRKLLSVLAAAVLSLSIGCVSNKKYLASKESAHQDSVRLASEIAKQQAQISEQQARIGQLKASGEFTSNQLNLSQEEIA